MATVVNLGRLVDIGSILGLPGMPSMLHALRIFLLRYFSEFTRTVRGREALRLL